MTWWQRLTERWAWHPPEDESAAKDQRVSELHSAAIDARIEFEESTARTRPLIARVERLANDYAKAEEARRGGGGQPR